MCSRLVHRNHVCFRITADPAIRLGCTKPVENDPNVWSGRALQEVSSTWQMRSCINVSGLWLERVVLRAIMDISAPVI
jgi:hypothetical protein